MGLLGGTFNPIHLGHLILAQTAMESFELERVLFMPCSVPPHKRSVNLASAEHRLAMVRLAIETDPRFDCSDMELQRGGISYAIDTVQELHRHNPGMECCFIIGADTLLELHQWKNITELLGLCRFVTVARPGVDQKALNPDTLQLPPPWPDTLLRDVCRSRMVDIASSDIRHRLAEGMSIRYLVPESVDMYIAEHRLYGGR